MPDRSLPDVTSPSAKKSIGILRRIFAEMEDIPSAVSIAENSPEIVIEPSAQDVLKPRVIPGGVRDLINSAGVAETGTRFTLTVNLPADSQKIISNDENKVVAISSAAPGSSSSALAVRLERLSKKEKRAA